MEAVSRGAKEAGGRTLAVTAKFFRVAREPVDRRRDSREHLAGPPLRTGQARPGYVACPGGTGTLVELAVVWEMLNKGAMARKPLVVLGDFWQPVIERVREVELGRTRRGGAKRRAARSLCHLSAADAAALSRRRRFLKREMSFRHSLTTRATICFEDFVSRPAEELLEFDRLKEIVGGFTTCAPAAAPSKRSRRSRMLPRSIPNSR